MTVRIGIVGVGRMGRRHAENLATRVPGASLVAACSPIGEELEWARTALGVPSLYKDYGDLLGDRNVNYSVKLMDDGQVMVNIEPY